MNIVGKRLWQKSIEAARSIWNKPTDELFKSQLKLVKSAMLKLIVFHLCAAFVVTHFYAAHPFSSGLVFWAGCLFVTITLASARFIFAGKAAEKDPSFSEARIYLCSLCLGFFWGAFPILSLSSATSGYALSVAAITITIVASSMFALATMPRAMFCFFLPAMSGLLSALILRADTYLSFLLIGFVLLIAALLLVISSTLNRSQIRHSKNEIELRKQRSIIGLLLAQDGDEKPEDWLWELDARGRFREPSQRLQDVCQTPEAELTSMTYADFLKERCSDQAAIDNLQRLIEHRVAFHDFEICLNKQGHVRYWMLTGRPSLDLNGDHIGYIGFGSDVTTNKQAELEKSRMALTDPLTGLMNRARFSEEIEAATAKLERYGSNFALMFLDLDKFKLVNDMRGHLVGDSLLKMVSERILNTVRETDSVARLGGDEFAIIMHEDCDAGAAARLAARLLTEVGKKYRIEGEFHSIGVSIGIALAPLNGTRPNQLLRNADLALYRSKADGRGVFRFFESQMDADQREKRMLELELREAIEQNQFELYYQPLVSSTTGMATGMEALIRWNHPIRGRVPPDEFVPIAEQTSLIQEIGNWTIREACKAAVEWPNDVVVSVNLSAQHLIGSDIVAYTRTALEESGLPPTRLELEITESLLINNAEKAVGILNSLKDLGVAIVLDDFGTGYSSLSYILKFPFDKIKIDRSFVKASSEDPAARSILQMVSGLGDSLGIRITAEGVETMEQVRFLNSIKCDQFQGFYFAEPLSTDALPAFFLSQVKQSDARSKVASGSA